MVGDRDDSCHDGHGDVGIGILIRNADGAIVVDQDPVNDPRQRMLATLLAWLQAASTGSADARAIFATHRSRGPGSTADDERHNPFVRG